MRKSLLFGFLFLAAGVVQGQNWRTDYDQSKKLYDQGNYPAALQAAQEALKSYLQEGGPATENHASLLRQLSNICFASENYTEGLTYVNKELQILASNKDTTYAGALSNQAQFYKSLHQYTEAAAALTESRDILSKYFRESDLPLIENGLEIGIAYYLQDASANATPWLARSVALAAQTNHYPDNSIEALYYYGLIQLDQEQSDDAASTFSNAQRLCEAADSTTNLTYVNVLSGLAKAYGKSKKYSKAEEIFANAQSICEKVRNKAEKDYFELLNSRALNLQLMGNQTKADELFALVQASPQSGQLMAAALSNNAARYQADGDYVKAEATYLTAIEKYDKQDQATLPGYAETLKNFAWLYAEKGDPANAAKRIDESLALLQNLYGPQHRKYLSALNLAALIYSRAGQPTKAMEFYKKVLQANSSGANGSAEVLAARNGIAVLYQNAGNFAKADSIYESLLARYTLPQAHLDASYLYTLNNFAASKQVQGKLVNALHLIQQLTRSTAQLYGKSGPEYARALDNLSILYLKLGDLNPAKVAMDSALQILAGHQNSLDYAGALTNLGHYYQLAGDYTRAEPYLKNAKDLVQSLKGKESVEYAGALNELALLYQKLGNYKDAGALLNESRDIFEKKLGKDNTSYSTALQNLATLYQLENKYGLAEQPLKEALEIDKRLSGESSPAYLVALQNLATLYQKLGKQAEAEQFLEQVLTISAKTLGTEHPSYITTLSNQAALYQDLGKFDLAEATWKQSLELRRKVLGEHHPDYAKSLYGLAGVYHARGQWEEARKYYEPVIQNYQSQIKEFFSTLSEKEKSAFYTKIKPVFDAYQDFCVGYVVAYPDRKAETLKKLYNLQLATKAILLEASSKMRSRILTSADTAVKAQFKKWLDIKQEIVRDLSYSSAEREQYHIDLPALENVANELEKKLSEKSDAFRSQFDKNNVIWEQVQQNLQAGEAALEIIRIKKKFGSDSVYYAGLLLHQKSDGPDLIIWPFGKQLETRWFKYHRNTIKFQFSDSLSYKKFWLPMQQKIGGETTLFISCDGVFNKVNFNSLYNPATRRWIIDDFTIKQLSSTRELTERRPLQAGNRTARLFGFADFNLGMPDAQKATSRGTARAFGFAGEDIPALPATEKELDGIDGVLQTQQWDVKAYKKNDASEENIKKIDNPRLIHIATHGFFLSDVDVNENEELANPLLRSGVLMAGAGVPHPNPTEEDGVLTAYEAMNLNLDQTEMVVLSACETGLGEIRNGEGVYGLQRSFIVAGARAVLMSLWQVDDVATQELMDSFYTLWLAGAEKHSAFRDAQKQLKIKYPAPYFWGAFVLVGN